MNIDPDLDSDKEQKADLSLCIICQEKKDENLVEKPSSHEKTLESIKEWATYGELKYIRSRDKLSTYSLRDLKERSSWHRSCYKNAVHSAMLKRAKERYERHLEGPNVMRRKQSVTVKESQQVTRSRTIPYDKEVCFFCEGDAGYRQSLHSVLTSSAGESLRAAIDMSSNDKLRVKLSSAIDPSDAHAIDIKYHSKCWANHVTTVLRRGKSQAPTASTDQAVSQRASKAAAQIEFLAMVENTLRNGTILTMSKLQEAYESILEANDVENPTCTRKIIKQLIKDEIQGVEFHKPKRVNESERVTIKSTRDFAIQQTEDNADDSDQEMRILFDAARFLRRSINKCKNWVFTGSFEDLNSNHLPQELYSFCRWLINGPKTDINGNHKSNEIHKRAMSLAQTAVSMCLTDRQKSNTKSKVIKSTRDMPQQLAVGLALRQSIRSKEIVNMLHGFGMSVEYNRLLRIEAQIEQSVLERMNKHGGVYLPENFVKNRHVFFAIDNVDFAEDTHDGSHTLHGTAMAIYQKTDPRDTAPQIRLDSQSSQDRTLRNIPESMPELMECHEPPKTPKNPIYPHFKLYDKDELPIVVRRQEFAWILGRRLSSLSHQTTQEPDELSNATQVPVWSAYNSLIYDPLDTTRSATPPLVAFPAHEWSTLLTVLKQAQDINTLVVGADRKTVVTLDLGLYQPAKRLQMARNDMDHLILRPGELHIVMAQLRTIGRYIENSGVDMCWVESGLYGTSTVKQIIEGKHVRRGQTAHLVTLQALYSLYQEAFFQFDEECYQAISQAAKELDEACAQGKKEDIVNKNTRMIDTISSLNVLEKMAAFDKANENRPIFKVMLQYMRMVTEMLTFIRAVRTGDWDLHLQTLAKFSRYFFVHDMINYARMIPIYLAEMESLNESDPDIVEEFRQGNWVVNKNSDTSFCALGADHALEHINRSMKVSGGLIGITLNPNARNKFFLIAPELARLAEEAKNMARLSKQKKTKEHHNLSTAILEREERHIKQLTDTIERFTNPFTEKSDDLFNLVTKVVVEDKVKDDLCGQSEIGRKLVETFVNERVKSNKVNVWAKMKKTKLLTWRSNGKKMRVALKDKVVELKEDRNLFARLMMVAKSRPEIDIKEAIKLYEFSVVPRSLFANDGTMLHCSMKSALMSILEKTGVSLESPDTSANDNSSIASSAPPTMTVAVVDGMAELQSLDKPQWVNNCEQLAKHFNDCLFHKYRESDEVRLVFDRYDLPSSLKTATRAQRQGTTDPVYYRITDTTQIAKVNMKRLLSHSNTKMELTVYLAQKSMEYAVQNGRRFVVSWACQCEATHQGTEHLQSDQEEADTKLILHAIDATTNGATTLEVHSPDTDVFVLSLRRYPELCQNTYFITGTGQRRRRISLQPIYHSLGAAKAAALPALHALSGADNTGSFSGKGKLACWKVFNTADEDVITALTNLGITEQPDEVTMNGIEKFVCQLYQPTTSIWQVNELRWSLFKKKQAQSERLPPTQGALREAILRAHYQSMVWNSDKIANPSIPSPENYGWKKDNEKWLPVMTTMPPAPEAIIELVKCGCAKQRCSTNRCQCRKAGLMCTELCTCSDDDDPCENGLHEDDDDGCIDDSDESDDSYDNTSDDDEDN